MKMLALKKSLPRIYNAIIEEIKREKDCSYRIGKIMQARLYLRLKAQYLQINMRRAIR
jgi:hypothetical protein